MQAREGQQKGHRKSKTALSWERFEWRNGRAKCENSVSHVFWQAKARESDCGFKSRHSNFTLFKQNNQRIF